MSTSVQESWYPKSGILEMAEMYNFSGRLKTFNNKTVKTRVEGEKCTQTQKTSKNSFVVLNLTSSSWVCWAFLYLSRHVSRLLLPDDDSSYSGSGVESLALATDIIAIQGVLKHSSSLSARHPPSTKTPPFRWRLIVSPPFIAILSMRCCWTSSGPFFLFPPTSTEEALLLHVAATTRNRKEIEC